MRAVIFAKGFWLYSQLSVARYSGGIDISEPGDDKRHFLIVDEKGQPFRGDLSPENVQADLVDKEFIPLYKKLGREKFIEIVKDNPLLSREELKNVLSEAADKAKAAKKAEKERKKAEIEAKSPSLDFQD